jgi:wobble nucleotide-excising tRNase
LSEASEKGFYKIVREDLSEVKETLSEGERTFITFLYFFQLLKGSIEGSGISKDKVVVFDDPISSLDSNILFVVSNLIKEVIQDCRQGKNGIKQVFVLTHNIYFHKEVTSRFGKDNGKRPIETFWIVRKLGNKSNIIKHEGNPIKTTYELLWRELDILEEINKATIFNTLRRILEYYFKIIGGLDYEKCINDFDGEEKIICKSLVSWINDGSHSINDDLVVYVESESIEKYLNVFNTIFKCMGHESHYNMMRKL